MQFGRGGGHGAWIGRGCGMLRLDPEVYGSVLLLVLLCTFMFAKMRTNSAAKAPGAPDEAVPTTPDAFQVRTHSTLWIYEVNTSQFTEVASVRCFVPSNEKSN